METLMNNKININNIKKDISIFCSISQHEIENVNCWLIPSLLKQEGISNITLILINYTGHGTIYQGEKLINNLIIKEINNNKHCGFGEAHNFAFSVIQPENNFLIINPDVYIHKYCIAKMIERMGNNDEIGIVEARQLPFEHPKEYELTTGETPWASGCCMLIKSKCYQEINGFDEKFWMYCEDVDLSWRTWLSGYKVIHEPMAVIYHFTGGHFFYRDDRYYLENFWCARNFIYLMYKFWGENGAVAGMNMLKSINYPPYFNKEVIKSFKKLKKYCNTRYYEINKDKINELNNIIKITGFNLYHKVR
jgi:GT2 family glycosyltransferase